MGRKLYVSQKKALMAWVDAEAAARGWDGRHARPPLIWPADSYEIPSDVYQAAFDLNPWESFHSSAVVFCQDYASWAYGGNVLWQWRRDHGHEGTPMHAPVTPAEADEWMRSKRY